jgi:hypothetical protein
MCCLIGVNPARWPESVTKFLGVAFPQGPVAALGGSVGNAFPGYSVPGKSSRPLTVPSGVT